MTRILVIAPELPWPPIYGYRAKLAGLLSHIGGDWDLIYGADNDALSSEGVPTGAGQLIPVKTRRYRRARALANGVLPSNARIPWGAVRPHVERVIASRRCYDVVHLDTLSMAHLASPIASLLRQRSPSTKIVCSPNDSYSLLLRSYPALSHRLRSLVARLFEKRFYSAADFVDVVSARDVSWLESGITKTPVRLIPLGVDVGAFDGPRLESKWDVLYVGGTAGVAPWIRQLLDGVLPALRRQLRGLRIALAGPPPPKWLLDRCLADGLTHLGFVDDLSELLRSSAMLVVPSNQIAGTPTKALEAMAAGTPVVGMSALDGVVNGADGVSYARARTWDELTQRMVLVLSDNTYAEQLSEGGKALVRREHDWHAIVARYWDSFPSSPG